MSNPWHDWLPYENRRLIANTIGSIAVIALLAGAIYGNVFAAKVVCDEPRLRICALAARELEPGRLLQKEDVVLRLRRPTAAKDDPKTKLPHYFDGTYQLAGRQLSRGVHRGEIFYDYCFIEPRRDAVFFAVSVDRTVAMNLTKGAQIVLVPQGEQEQVRRWPQFELVEPVDLAKLKDNATTVSLKLKAQSAIDAMHVVAATANNAKLVPLVLPPPVTPAEPKAATPPATTTRRK